MGRALAALLALFLGAASAWGGTAPEPVHFDSLDGTPLTGWLFKAPGDAVRGTVVALHGCDGLYGSGAAGGPVSGRHAAMAKLLVADGYAVLLPDSLTARGQKELCTQPIGQRAITQVQRRHDTLAARAWVARQPWADPGRIAVLGWSHGGSAVLAATDAGNSIVASATAGGARPFAVAIAFYPGCSLAASTRYRPDAPLLLLLGADDDWTPPGPCISLGRAVGAEVEVYANSYHGFDAPGSRVRLRRDVPNGLRPGEGVHVGPNPIAREAAHARVRAVLAATLRAP